MVWFPSLVAGHLNYSEYPNYSAAFPRRECAGFSANLGCGYFSRCDWIKLTVPSRFAPRIDGPFPPPRSNALAHDTSQLHHHHNHQHYHHHQHQQHQHQRQHLYTTNTTTNISPTPTSPTPATTTTATTMSPVLNYFGFPGRWEATRVALAVAGVSYEDKRLSPAEFGASSFMAVPVYQVRNTI